MSIAVSATRLGDAPDSFDDAQRRVIAQIEDHGWRTTGVAGRPGYPAFAYTTGLWLTHGISELICFDLPPETCHNLFGLVARAAAAGRHFAANTPVPGLLEGEAVWFLPVDRAQADAYLPASRWFYRDAEFPAWQLVWPDAAGRFPWQDGFEPGLVGVQPDLSGTGDWCGAPG